MKLSVTVNLGGYENLKLESSEYDTIQECRAEIDAALAIFEVAQVADFRKRVTYEVS